MCFKRLTKDGGKEVAKADLVFFQQTMSSLNKCKNCATKNKSALLRERVKER
jgi:hypothetical protein